MTKNTFKNHWEAKAYRKKFLVYVIATIILLILMPFGFDFIQGRGGLTWNDLILNLLPAFDLSIPIFLAIYSLGLLFILRVNKNPHLLLLFIKSYIIVTITRFVLIYFIPLDPPAGMIELVDPITKIFYGGKLITRDLFFSGHTSTMFLMFLVLEKKSDRLIALSITIFIAVSLIFQHIHYTADVLAAFPITWIIWKFCS